MFVCFKLSDKLLILFKWLLQAILLFARLLVPNFSNLQVLYLGMVEWLVRLFRNHCVRGSALAGTITRDAYSCEKRMNEIAHEFMKLSTRLKHRR